MTVAVYCSDPAEYQGAIVPLDFIPLMAPENTLRTANWMSSSNGIKLESIQPEGKPVKKDEVIAEFEFGFDDVKGYMQHDLDSVKARKEKELLKLAKDISEMMVQLEKNQILTEMAFLETRKKSLVAVNKQKIIEYNYRQQAVEKDALEQKLTAARKNYSNREKYYNGMIKDMEIQQRIVDDTRIRYTVKAPADGELYYPILSTKNKKAAAGSGMDCGTHFLSVVTSTKSELIFYLPENDFSLVKVGDQVTLITAAGNFTATVHAISCFPKLMGDVLSNYSLPDSWENCFVVKAALPVNKNSKPILEGNVKVRLMK
ncbi:MAG: hypothetical protein PHW04_15195 [Candidatus Wallbacteria bacterium]|nr:hypothetical protein [Candidatus Wallbacteria bacterium]